MSELSNMVNEVFDDFFRGCDVCQKNNREDFMVNKYMDFNGGPYYVATCKKCGKIWSLVSREATDRFVKVPLL